MTPLPRLQEHVRRYCGYSERTPAPLRRREVPSGDVTLIISFGPDIALLSPTDPDGRAERRTSFVAGIDDAYAVTEHAGEQHGIEVNLSPLGAGMLLGVPMGHVGKQVIELDDLLGPDAERLTARLYDAASWEARLMLSSESDDRYGGHTGSEWSYVVVDDPDGLFERARTAGAEIVQELIDTDYGSRDFSVRDPEGNLWSFGTYHPLQEQGGAS